MIFVFICCFSKEMVFAVRYLSLHPCVLWSFLLAGSFHSKLGKNVSFLPLPSLKHARTILRCKDLVLIPGFHFESQARWSRASPHGMIRLFYAFFGNKKPKAKIMSNLTAIPIRIWELEIVCYPNDNDYQLLVQQYEETTFLMNLHDGTLSRLAESRARFSPSFGIICSKFRIILTFSLFSEWTCYSHDGVLISQGESQALQRLQFIAPSAVMKGFVYSPAQERVFCVISFESVTVEKCKQWGNLHTM